MNLGKLVGGSESGQSLGEYNQIHSVKFSKT